MDIIRRLRHGLLLVTLALAGLLGTAPAASAQAQNPNVEKLAQILDQVPGGVGGIDGAALRSIEGLFTCLDSGTDALECLRVAQESSGSSVLSGGLPSWFWMFVDAYIAVREDDVWGVVVALGEAIVCVVVQALTGNDICALIEALIELGKAVYDAVAAVLEWIADLGDAIWGVIRGVACEIYSWFGGDCDDEEAPPPIEGVIYGVFFAPPLANNTGLTKIEAGGSQFIDHVGSLRQQAERQYPGNSHAAWVASQWYEDNVHAQWTADILEQVMPALIQARQAYTPQEVVRSETDAVWGAVVAGSWPNDANLTEQVFSKLRERCSHRLNVELGFGHVSSWVNHPKHRDQASEAHIVSNTTWCGDMWLDPNRPEITRRVREQVETSLCPESPNGQLLVCPSQEALRVCRMTMSYFGEQDRCQNLAGDLEEKCPTDAQGRHLCTTPENYAYCQQNLPQSGLSGQCEFGPKVTISEHCPDVGQIRRACTSEAYYKFCKDHIADVNALTGQVWNCGWSREAANDLLQSVKGYFEQQGSRHPCTTTPVSSNHQAVKYTCSRPVQRAVCRDHGDPDMLTCDGTNNAAYDALAAQVASEVTRLNAPVSQLDSSSASQKSKYKPQPRPADQTLQVDGTDPLAVRVLSASYCDTLSRQTTIPSTTFPVPPSGGPRFEFDCSPSVGDQGPPAPGASVDGYTTPRILIPYTLNEDKLKGRVDKKIDTANIVAVGQKRVGPGPVDELARVQDRVRDGDFSRVDMQRTDVQQDAQKRVGAVTIDAAQKTKVAGKLAGAQVGGTQVHLGETGIQRPDEEVQATAKVGQVQAGAGGKLVQGQAGPAQVAGAQLAGGRQPSAAGAMVPMMGQAPAGAGTTGAPPPVSAAPSAPTVKPDLTAESRVTLGNRTADWNASLMLDAREAMRASNGVCLFTLRYTARNGGPGPAGAFSSTLSNSTTPNPSERLWPGLDPGASSAQSDVVSLKSGLNILTLWLDQKNEVSEMNEANNQVRLSVNLTGACEATARVVRPGTTVAAGTVPVNPVTGLPAIQAPKGTGSATLSGGAQVAGKPSTTATPLSATLPAGGVVVSKAGAAATPQPGAVISVPGTLTTMGMGVDLLPAASLVIAGRKVDWNGAASFDMKDAQRAEGGVCTFGVQYAVRNGGNAASGAFNSTLSISTGGAAAEASWGALAAGAQGERSDALDLTPGVNMLTLVVDRAGQIKESNETNNQVGLQVRVSGTCGAAVPPPAIMGTPKPPTIMATPTPATVGPKVLTSPAPLSPTLGKKK